ncbi:hypothetical protein KBD08_03680 [Candidatus Babeliales bacterium]|nr:hypothetical protein [Candidatus Babeliales bacterium]
MDNNQFFAEVIQAGLTEWTGQCWKWDFVPNFGSLVTAQQKGRTWYGIVHDIKTESNDPMRAPFAYQKTEEELLRDQPQIFEFLQTTFRCITVGYKDDQKILYHLPPQPPKIHTFISLAKPNEYQTFFASTQFLHLLFNFSSQLSNFDELLLVLFKTAQHHTTTPEQTIDFIETFSTLYKNDYQKLKIFLQRLELLQEQKSL